MKQNVAIKQMVVISLLCAFALISMFVFRISDIGGFLTFDIKDAILAMIALIYGPIWGLASAIVVPLLEMLLVSKTAFWGFVMNALSSATFAVVCGVIYRYRRNMFGAVIGISTAAFATVAVMLLANIFVTPVYLESIGVIVSREFIISIMPTLLLPFNAIKAVSNGALVLAIYKPFTTALKRTGLLPKSDDKYHLNRNTVVVLVISVFIVALSIFALIYFMEGSFQWLRNLDE